MPPDLLSLIQHRCRTWSELADAGLSRAAVLTAIGDLVADGAHRVLVGPLVVGLETRPDGQALLPPTRRRVTVDPAALLTAVEESLLARLGADAAIDHLTAGLVGDHLMVVCDDLRTRHGLSVEVPW
ncbi:MAG: hypothetical protein JNM56_40730 [Planctomycetia bacterium]|nr:hypothetical protein [Planctomycetia bacterium]